VKVIQALDALTWPGPLLEVSSGRNKQGIPGAIQIHPCYVESGWSRAHYFPRYHCASDARLLPLLKLRQALGQLGLCHRDPVLVYGVGSLHPMGLARVTWAMLAAGMENVTWLNGGLVAWLAAGGRLAPHRAVAAAVDFGDPPDVYGQRVTHQLDGGSGTLVDLRSRAEYLGTKCDRYSFFHSCGHVPGAIWGGDWTRLVEGRCRSLKPLAWVGQDWRRRGISPDSEVIFYCGTGWRSSLACLMARRLGYAGVRNYDGGIFAGSLEGLTLIPGA
jgi:thiosulfate/3-mercaptopyruvate sulfurtransferase